MTKQEFYNKCNQIGELLNGKPETLDSITTQELYKIMDELRLAEIDKPEERKGFTIKCNECGKETIYTQGENWKETDNENITILSYCYTYDCYTYETIEKIYCECGNKVEDEPQED